MRNTSVDFGVLAVHLGCNVSVVGCDDVGKFWKCLTNGACLSFDCSLELLHCRICGLALSLEGLHCVLGGLPLCPKDRGFDLKLRYDLWMICFFVSGCAERMPADYILFAPCWSTRAPCDLPTVSSRIATVPSRFATWASRSAIRSSRFASAT